MDLLNPKLVAYLHELAAPDDEVLREMESYARQKNFPIIGPLVGRLCFQLVKMLSARRIFEMGSGFGYSAYWMAQALPNGAKIILTDTSQENLQRARNYFDRGAVGEKAEFRTGDACQILQASDEEFDIVFNDIEKERYPEALEVISPRLRTGGVLITDNMFWHGRVLEREPDVQTEGILKYTTSLFQSPEWVSTIVPLRDGVAISLKM